MQDDAQSLAMKRIRHIHFVGIGGAGMSGIAEVLYNQGYKISGSDMRASSVTRHLTNLGIDVYIGHDGDHVNKSDAIVVSSAVSEQNAEVQAAREARIPVVPRAEMLSELMRFRFGIAVAGTHGKTTTTSMLASVLTHGGLEPTFIIGGRVKSFSSNALLGNGQYILAEADESDGSFLYLNPVISVITNIDKDHLVNYGDDPIRLEHAFLKFVHHLPFYGLVVTCLDDPVVRKLLPEFNRPVLTYGLDAEANVHATDIKQDGIISQFQVSIDEERYQAEIKCGGEHNVRNALATIAVARELGMPMPEILSSLSEFSGIQRRFDIVGTYVIDGIHDILVIDDYAHHPNEIASILKAVRTGWPERRIVTVFQPHRYSRTRELFEDFVQVLSGTDVLILTEVYAAGEQPIPGVEGKRLSGAIRQRGRTDPVYIENIKDVIGEIPALLRDHDIVLLIGAGNISTVSDEIRQEWKAA